MNTESLQSIIMIFLSLFLIVIFIMLIHPQWRKKITEPQIYSPKNKSTLYIADLLSLIIYPIIWLFKILKSLFN